MSTRCVIEFRDRGIYRIYRHTDGYPDGVLGDIKRAKEILNGIGDAEYFLANFIFLAKYSSVKEGTYWYSDYGVCSLDCEHGDIEYKYILWRNQDGWNVEIWRYEHYPNEFRELIFRGKLEEAIDRFVRYFKDGCHITHAPPMR